jgi:hypothetical protein
MGLGSGIRDPGSGKNLFWIPDPGVKKAPDPEPVSGSATMVFLILSVNTLVPGNVYAAFFLKRISILKFLLGLNDKVIDTDVQLHLKAVLRIRNDLVRILLSRLFRMTVPYPIGSVSTTLLQRKNPFLNFDS